MVATVRGARGWIVAAMMASMFMIAIEATIVATAMPFIVAQLGGMDLYSWSFAIFLLAQTTTPVLFGKLADMYGRKPVVLAGIAIFVAGSLLAGLAWSMPSLILFRLVQGVGAGAVQPLTMTIIADLYPARERAKVQGWLASVWATSSVAGPIAGGAIIQSLSWPWIFWMSVPIGLLAAATYIVGLRDTVEHASPSIDYPGAILFTLAIGALMLALSAIGTTYERLAGWALLVAGTSGIAFVVHERRAKEPIISFELWRRRAIASANAVVMLTTLALMGLTAFLPMYVQAVMQRSAVVAGLAMTMMTLGWPLGAIVASQTFHRLGLRNVLLFGALLQPAGALCLVFLTPQSSPALAGAGSAIMGFGMGLISICCMLLIQEAARPGERGSATAANVFSRNVGSAFGATVFGVVVNLRLAGAAGDGSRVTAEDLKRMLEAPGGGLGSSPALFATLAGALHTMFLAMLAVALLVVVASLFVPDDVFSRKPKGAAGATDPSNAD